MPREKDDAAYLWDMVRYSRIVCNLIAGKSLDDYRTDIRLQLAVERGIEVIGEAAREISVEFEEAHPNIPWQKIVAQRHVLAHEYGDIDPVRIWTVATVHIPALISKLETLLPPSPLDPESDSQSPRI